MTNITLHFLFTYFFVCNQNHQLTIHLAFDLQSFYPASILPTSLSSLRSWYMTTYADRFFSASPPAW
jgi:hypothetical protein